MGKWKLWSDGVTLPSIIPRELQFCQIIVPTKITIRNQHLISLLACNQKMVMFVGDTASGKTTDVTVCTMITFSIPQSERRYRTAPNN